MTLYLRVPAPASSPYSGAVFSLEVTVAPSSSASSSALLTWRWLSPIYHPCFSMGGVLCSCMLLSPHVSGANQARSPVEVLRHVLLLLEKPHYTMRCAHCVLHDQAFAEAVDDHVFFLRKARVRTPGAEPLSDEELRGMCHASAVASASAPASAPPHITAAAAATATATAVPSAPSAVPSLDFSHLLTSGIFSDLKVLVGKTSFRCHRTILAARSPVFRKHFEEGLDHGLLRVNASSSLAFARLLQYVYGSRLAKKEDLSLEQHFELFELAVTYGIAGLRNYHLGCLTSLLTAQSIPWALAKAESTGNALLIHTINTYLVNHPEALQPQRARDSPGPTRRTVSRARDMRHSPY